MEAKLIQEKIKIPEGVQITLGGNLISAKGKKGAAERKIVAPNIKITQQNQEIVLETKGRTRHTRRILYTVAAHIKNLTRGVNEGYVYKLKICSGHFPISVKVDGSNVVISNFLGEKIPRKSPILAGAKVTISGDLIEVEGTDLEITGQTAANIEVATKIKNRDRRIFQDGIYITEKPERVQNGK